MAHVPAEHGSYSNLEVAEADRQDTFKYKAPEVESGPIPLDPHAFPEAVKQPHMYDASQHAAVDDSNKEVVSSRGKRRRLLIILGVLVGIVVIVGAVVGGVLGSRHSKSAAEDATPTQDSNSSAPADGPRVLRTSKLAAVNWTSDDDNGVHYRAVFWQATTNDLMASIWESDNQKWSNVNLTVNGTMDVKGAYNQQYVAPKPGTPLAATVRRDNPFPKFANIALFYLSERNTVEQINSYTMTAKSGWGMCCLSSTANKKTAAQTSQLAAFSTACLGSQCKNDWIHVAYQADNNNNIYEISQRDWSDTPRQLTGPKDVPQPGTGLTMASTGSPFSNDSKAFFPKMYLQTPTELQEKLWFPDSSSSE